MLTSLVGTVGIWFFVACALEFAAVFAEQAGGARSPEEEGARRHSLIALLALIASLLTPGLLLAHGFRVTEDDETLRITALATPIVAMLVGALLGAIFGAVVRGSANAMRLASLPISLVALAVAVYASWPSINVWLAAAQSAITR